MDKRFILCLDGSTSICSAALLAPLEAAGQLGGPWETAAYRQEGDGRAHARVLLSSIDGMLRGLGQGPEALAAVVVGLGPGTFTGVRITVATARALGLSLSIPVAGISTLAALAAAAAEARPEAGLIVPVVDARRGQLFYGMYEREGKGPGAPARWKRRLPFAVCDREDLATVVEERARVGEKTGEVILVGEKDLLEADLPVGIRILAAGMRAETLVLGQGRLLEPGPLPQGDRLETWLLQETAPRDGAAPGTREAGAPGTPETVKPIYVRSPDADIHITKMRDPWAGTKGPDS